MDTTLSDYQKLQPEKYLEAVVPLIEETKAVDGTLIGVWHNYALADDEGTHKALKEILKNATGQ